MSTSRVFNELAQSPCVVWSRLNPAIDPTEWAAACRVIGQLPAKEFTRVFEHARRKRRQSLTRAMDRLLDDLQETRRADRAAKSQDNDPLVSIGPSGIGGPYQVEMNHRKFGIDKELT